MAFKKRHIHITQEVLQEVLKEVRVTFNNSDAPEYLKNKLYKIDPIFDIIKRPNWNFYGAAFAVGRCAKKCAIKRKAKLTVQTHPSVILEHENYFLVIQINKGLLRMVTRRGLRYLVAHELAHLLLIVLNQEVKAQFSYSTINDHDEEWIKVCKWMGGKGEALIGFDEIWC